MNVSKRDLLFVSLALVALFAAVAAWPGYSQGRRTSAKSVSNAAASKTTTASVTTTTDPRWTTAAQQNAQLQNDLAWVFGGKEQHGWALYAPLIAHTLETEADDVSPDFAQALARWQRGAGLTANGVLFGDTLYKLVATWQSHRLKDHTYPSPDQLLTAPATDFYDAARPDDQRQVEKATYAAYKRMVAAAVADRSLGLSATRTGELAAGEKYLKIISAFRSRERQEQLR
ncbi:MAG TPA: hypothetical protein VE775_08930, partial [Pyrinomonadaceae bacterium]|nr:hypothetical protein [Pyrinomonadaceae bacterium]